MLPSTWQRGQKACLIEPQGFLGSVPKFEVPLLPATKPGAVLVNLMSTMLCLLVFDLMW